MILVQVYSYDNPTNQCADASCVCDEDHELDNCSTTCDNNTNVTRRACDNLFVYCLNQRISPSQSAPDVDVYRNVCLGALQVESTTKTNWNAMEINFTEGIVLGLGNPLRLRLNSSCLVNV